MCKKRFGCCVHQIDEDELECWTPLPIYSKPHADYFEKSDEEGFGITWFVVFCLIVFGLSFAAGYFVLANVLIGGF